MPPPRISSSLLLQFRSLSLQSSRLSSLSDQLNILLTCLGPTLPRSLSLVHPAFRSSFSTTPQLLDWLTPRRRGRPGKTQKGRPQCNTGGSIRGTTLAYGSWGLRLLGHDLRISAKHFR